MAIEFRCNECQRLLRVPDQSAGAQARCPQCSRVQQVPLAAMEATVYEAHPVPPAGENSRPPNPFADDWLPNASSGNPYASPFSEGYLAPYVTAEQARSKVMAPAIAVIILAAVGLLALAVVSVGTLIELGNKRLDGESVVLLIVVGVGVVIQGLTIAGAIRAIALKNYGLALTAAILALLTGTSCLLSLPFAVWLMVVLCDSNVKAHFR